MSAKLAWFSFILSFDRTFEHNKCMAPEFNYATNRCIYIYDSAYLSVDIKVRLRAGIVN